MNQFLWRQRFHILGKKAHKIKLRGTIAVWGQGRWKEELDFPSDWKASGYTPVLVGAATNRWRIPGSLISSCLGFRPSLPHLLPPMISRS